MAALHHVISFEMENLGERTRAQVTQFFSISFYSISCIVCALCNEIGLWERISVHNEIFRNWILLS